jgi:uncharacterized protein YcnI
MKKYFVALAGIMVSAFASAVLAHATVKSDMGLSESKVGSYETYRLQVPTEKPLDTTEVKLFVPQGLTVSTFQSVAGFERSVEKNADGIVTTVTWKGKIGQQEFQRFLFSAKNPAQPTTLLFKVYQTYSDGSVVKWEDEDPKGKTPASRVEIK